MEKVKNVLVLILLSMLVINTTLMSFIMMRYLIVNNNAAMVSAIQSNTQDIRTLANTKRNK